MPNALLGDFQNLMTLPNLLLILRTWWWLFPPIIFYFPFRYLYLWWIRWEKWYPKNPWILLQIVPPKEIENPFKSMEDVYNVLWGIYDGANWREQWCEGELLEGPFWLSFEIASIGGKIGFYIRCLAPQRDLIESTLYSHFPEIEISLVEDYTQSVPQDIPNEEWDLYSEDYTTIRDDVYPIKTYPMFFEERPEAAKVEEIRIDPLDSLLEALANLNPSEQVWFQMVAAPITDGDIPWIRRGRAEANKIAKRPTEEKAPTKSIFEELAEFIATGEIGPPPPPPKEEGLIAPELRLTPGEREILRGVENKISKQGWKTWMRIVYVYKRKEPHFLGNYKTIRSYLNHFMTENLNSPVFWGPTRTRIHYWFHNRRLYLRKRKNFRNYVQRLPSLFPRTMDGEPMFSFGVMPRTPGIRGTIVFNSEELATIYHFPAKITTLAPALAPIEAKKAGPPAGLPVEE
jgi:hypothetical protein